MVELILVIMVIFVTMVYGPIAAFLVEMFPTKIRYTSMSLPYHIGNGWFGGMLPLLATAVVAATGDIYAGLWYPIGVAVMTLVVGLCSCATPRASTSPRAPAWRSRRRSTRPKRYGGNRLPASITNSEWRVANGAARCLLFAIRYSLLAIRHSHPSVI